MDPFPVPQKKNKLFLLVFFVEHEVNERPVWGGHMAVGERRRGVENGNRACLGLAVSPRKRLETGCSPTCLCMRITWDPPREFRSPGPVTLGLRQRTPQALPRSQLRGLSSLSPLSAAVTSLSFSSRSSGLCESKSHVSKFVQGVMRAVP